MYVVSITWKRKIGNWNFGNYLFGIIISCNKKMLFKTDYTCNSLLNTHFFIKFFTPAEPLFPTTKQIISSAAVLITREKRACFLGRRIPQSQFSFLMVRWHLFWFLEIYWIQKEAIKGVLHLVPQKSMFCDLIYLKIINTFLHASYSKLSKELKNGSGILVDPVVFKLWVKTVKMMFGLNNSRTACPT